MKRRMFPAWLANGFLPAFCLFLAFATAALAQTSTNNSIPVVTIQATDVHGLWTGDPAVFTVFRSGNPTPSLSVYCCISGTATNGVDYKNIGSFVSLPEGVLSNNIVISPINLGQTDIRTVTVGLCPSPLMNPVMPVNYTIGQPDSATVYLTPPGVGNLPPVVSFVSPTNDSVFYVPASIPLIAKAGDPDGSVTNVEFFAGATDLGRGLPVVLDPPGMNGVTGLVYFFNWQNVPAGGYSLTAVASDDGGLTTTSTPVNIKVLTGPTNLPPIVRITSPPNGTVFRAPVKIPLYAFAADRDGYVDTVEFFADNISLGFGHPVTALPPPYSPLPVIQPTNYWTLVWTNPPLGTNIVLTAKATDNDGAATVSDPVQISVLPSPPPPTNRPPVLRLVATDPVAIEGTNCWPWPVLAGTTPTWSNWLTAGAVFQLRTNCGPKNATFTVFRFGATNDDLDVAYDIGGTATNGMDYIALPGVVTVPAGERRADINIVPLDDGPPDINSTVILKLIPDATGTNYVLGYPHAAAAIILDSASPRATTGVLPGAAFNLSATGPDGAWFHIEYSTDLTHWMPICTNQVVNGRIDFVDPDAATNPARYYRAVPEAAPVP